MKSFADYSIILPAGALGPEVPIPCPKCSHERKKKNTKCLSVNIEKMCWHCAHCGWSGGLGQGENFPKELHWQKPKYRKPEPRPLSLSGKVMEWLLGRGITEQVMIDAKIEADRAYFPQTEDYADAIVFPYFRGGELINRKYRMIDEKNFRMEAGCELLLYGLDDIDEEYLVWTEGEVDCLSNKVAGIKSVISVPNGAPPVDAKDYESKLAFLDRDWEKIDRVKKHILAFDTDAPGQRLEEAVRRRLGIEKCVRVKFPEGIKDSNELLLRDGPDELRRVIQDAEPYPIEGIIEVVDRADALARLYKFGVQRGASTSWKSLDDFYTVKPGQFTVITGIPGSGKSGLIDCMLVKLSKSQGWSFAVFSPENLPVEEHMAALAEKYSGMPFGEGLVERMTEDDANLALDWVYERFKWILPDDEMQWTVDNILKIAGQACLRYGIRGLLIDPWNELEASRPPQQTETEFISQSLRRLRMFARMRNIHLWIVVHPAKLQRDKEGKYPVPTLYDCHGSAHWRNKADNGIVVWRDFEDESDKATGRIEVHVQKVRFRQIGRLGTANLFYEKVCATYSDEPKGGGAQNAWNQKETGRKGTWS